MDTSTRNSDGESACPSSPCAADWHHDETIASHQVFKPLPTCRHAIVFPQDTTLSTRFFSLRGLVRDVNVKGSSFQDACASMVRWWMTPTASGPPKACASRW